MSESHQVKALEKALGMLEEAEVIVRTFSQAGGDRYSKIASLVCQAIEFLQIELEDVQ